MSPNCFLKWAAATLGIQRCFHMYLAIFWKENIHVNLQKKLFWDPIEVSIKLALSIVHGCFNLMLFTLHHSIFIYLFFGCSTLYIVQLVWNQMCLPSLYMYQLTFWFLTSWSAECTVWLFLMYCFTFNSSLKTLNHFLKIEWMITRRNFSFCCNYGRVCKIILWFDWRH